MTAIVRAAVLANAGLDSYPAEVTARITPGDDEFTVTVTGCLPPDEVTLRDRLRAAVLNSGFAWPSGHIVAGVKTRATAILEPCCLDLAIAVAVLSASGQCPEPPASAVFLAGLGLDGSLRRIKAADVLTMAASLPVTGRCHVMCHPAEMRDISCIEGVAAIGCLTLGRVVRWLEAVQAAGARAGQAAAGPGSGGA